MSVGVINRGGGGVGPVKIEWTTAPTATQKIKKAPDLTGAVITSTWSDGYTENVTSACAISPSVYTEAGTQDITATYAWHGKAMTAKQSVNVANLPDIVTWAGGTDAQILEMIQAADDGLLNLSDYWAVGDERTVSLSAMAATGVGESHVAQTVTLVLMNAGGKTLTAGGTCNFIVGVKNGLANGTAGEYGYMNSGNDNTGGWSSCARRTWCNSIFYNALPSTLKGIFKQFSNTSGVGGGASSGLQTTNDYFALPAEKEIFGARAYAQTDEAAALTQFTYYETSSNRIKHCGNSGSAYYWWGRSPGSGDSSGFCSPDRNGGADYSNAYNSYLLAPFGCI